MANTPKPTKRRIKQPKTIRQQAQTADTAGAKPRKIRRIVATGSKPFKKVHKLGKKEYYVPMPSNRAGRFLNKRRSFIPAYFRNSYKELREVKWPDRKKTVQLTLAVFVFAGIFGTLVTLVDYGLDKVFKNILLK